MSYFFDVPTAQARLAAALTHIQNYSRDTYPMFMNSLSLIPDNFRYQDIGFLNVPNGVGTAENQTTVAIAFLKAFEATNTDAFRTVANSILDNYRKFFYYENIYNVSLSTPETTALVRNNRYLTIYDSIQGDFDSPVANDPFNNLRKGTFTFTNGLANLPITLRKVFRVFSGELAYENIDAPLISGTEYKINYYVDSYYYRNYPDSETRNITGSGLGTLVIVPSTFSGDLTVIYSLESGSNISPPSAVDSFTGVGFVSTYPAVLKAKEGTDREYSEINPRAFYNTYLAFDLANKHTPYAFYQHARDVTKANFQRYFLTETSETYIIEKHNSNETLRHPGLSVSSISFDDSDNDLSSTDFSILREPSGTSVSRFIKLIINAAATGISNRAIQLKNQLAKALVGGLNDFTVEYMIGTDAVGVLCFSTSPEISNTLQIYKALFKLNSNGFINTQTIQISDFVRYSEDLILADYIIDNSTSYTGATIESSSALYEDFNTVIAEITLPDNNATAVLNTEKFSGKLPNIRYKVSGFARVQFGIFQFDLNDTGDNWQTFSSFFSVADLSSITFLNQQTEATIIEIFSIGDGDFDKASSNILIYSATFQIKTLQALTAWVGDIKISENSLEDDSYQPGVVYSLMSNTSVNNIQLPGKQYAIREQSPYVLSLWGLTRERDNVINFLNAAQENYKNNSSIDSTCFLTPFYSPFALENKHTLDRKTVLKKSNKVPSSRTSKCESSGRGE